MNPIGSIIRSAQRKEGDPLNILVFSFDGRFEHMMAQTGHNFYITSTASRFAWNTKTIPINKNYIILPNMNQLPINIDCDLVLCNDREQYRLASQIAAQLHVPLILVEHIFPVVPLSIPRSHTQVLVTESMQSVCGDGAYIIPYGIQELNNNPCSKEQLVIFNGEFKNTDIHIIEQIMDRVSNYRIITPHIQLSHDDLITLYNQANIYVNLATNNYLPIQLLEAMSAGCAIISNGIPALEGILTDKNSIVCSSIENFRETINRVQTNSTLCETLSVAAQTTISTYFNIGNFIKHWNGLLNNIASIVYTGE